ncbi:hypothetical protein Fmac_028441 [Flemingia macrophylla]|uniref:Gamma-tubulin complex component n=1 Tax=Flemingia macrophylla TaxID=520843 RepID=A0ABD1L7H9_9FABA
MNQTTAASFEKPIGCYSPSVQLWLHALEVSAIFLFYPEMQELIVIDDVLSAMVGIEGRYILIKTVRGNNGDISFLVDPSMDLALQVKEFSPGTVNLPSKHGFGTEMKTKWEAKGNELAKRIFPLCKSFLLINQFVESRFQFQSGLVNHAFSAALRALLLVGFPEHFGHQRSVQSGPLGPNVSFGLSASSVTKGRDPDPNELGWYPNLLSYHIALIKIHYLNKNLLLASWDYLYQDYQAMVAQLEHQFRLGRLSLQGLWFYCQPMMRSLQALSTVIQKASVNNFSGSAVLNLLQSQAKAMAGDNTVRLLLEKMTHCASSAYMSILKRWVYEGVIDDPYGEFFIAEDKSLQKESLIQDYEAKYWRQRYSLKEGIPSFLTNIAGTILTTGKYLNVMRECGHNVQVPPSENLKLMSFGSHHHYLECIKVAYNFASGELLNLIKEKYDLTGRLRSIKHYLLLDQGDFLVHFMDIARDELAKKPDEVSVEKLQSLLDLALRTTAAAADPFHEGLTCVERSSLLRRLDTFNDLEDSQRNSGNNDLEEPVSITGLETFSLSYKVHWPLSIVLSRKALAKYQLIFRFLFHCKHVDRQLCGAWQVHQVIEPNWHLMYNRLQSANSIDEVIQHHDFFLDKCLRECLLLLPELLKKVERLKSMCLQYAAATQWLISSSIELHNPGEPIDNSIGLNKAKYRKLGQVLKSTTRNVAVTDSVLKFEKEFNTELQSLGSILSSSSQAEPYLAHLAQWILGVKNEQKGSALPYYLVDAIAGCLSLGLDPILPYCLVCVIIVYYPPRLGYALTYGLVDVFSCCATKGVEKKGN